MVEGRRGIQLWIQVREWAMAKKLWEVIFPWTRMFCWGWGEVMGEGGEGLEVWRYRAKFWGRRGREEGRKGGEGKRETYL